MVISIVVIGISVTGTLLIMDRAIANSADPMLLHQAVAIAEAYTDEILLRDFFDPDTVNPTTPADVCPGAEADRENWDNVCDFNGVNDNPPQNHLGENFSANVDLSQYRVTVTVGLSNELDDVQANNELQVVVNVVHTAPGIGQDLANVTLTSYRTLYAQ